MGTDRFNGRSRLPLGLLALLAASYFIPVSALAQVSVTIAPSTINLSPSGTQQFTATVSGSNNANVAWTIAEGAAGGTLSSSGFYAAPAQPGTYHVVATRVADGSQSATATIVVPGFITWGLTTPRSNHTATLLPDGRILFAGGSVAGAQTISNSAELYDSTADRTTSSANMIAARSSHTATLLPNGTVLIAGGQGNAGTLASAEIFNPVSGTFAGTGSMNLPRSGHTATLLSNGQVLIAGGLNCSTSCVNSAELYNPSSGNFSLAGPMARIDQYQSATLLKNGKVLFALGVVNRVATADAELYDPATGQFTIAGSMTMSRQSGTATLLQNGNVLFAGGLNGSGAVTATAEIYNSSSGTFVSTGNLNAPRDFHTATLLTNGKVIIAGGNSTATRSSTAETYDPSSGTFTQTGALGDPRIDHTATLLSNGTVLIAAGFDGQILGSTEIYDPSGGIFNHHGAFMTTSRANHTATALANGKILFAGGENLHGTTATAELFDPATMTFTPTGSMTVPREDHTATLLSNGEVLVVGGTNDSQGSGTIPLSSAEIYNPATGTFSATPGPNVARMDHTATLLGNGKVLITGGLVPGYPPPPNNLAYASAELFDPTSGTFALTQSMTTPRFDHTATLLNDERVFIAGGVDEPGYSNTGAPAEIYDPNAGTFMPVIANVPSLEPQPAYPFSSVMLSNGQVLAGINVIFNPAANAFFAVNIGNIPSSVSAAGGYSSVLLPNGQVLLSGSLQAISNSNTATAAYLFDPNSIGYFTAGNLRHSRSSPTQILLPNNLVLITGGDNSPTPSDVLEAEFYQAPGAGFAASIASVAPNSFTGFTPANIVVTGTNFASGASIELDGAALQTTFISNTQLSATIPLQTLLVPGNHTVSVANSTGLATPPVTITVTNPQLQTPYPSGTTLSLGNATVGASNSQLLSFTNAGNAAANFDSITIASANSGDFAIDPANTTCPLLVGTLAPSATCLVSIKFAPQAIRSSTAVLTTLYEMPGSPYILMFTAAGVSDPIVSIAPANLSFGSQAVGGTSPAQPLTITNFGTNTLVFASRSSTDSSDFPAADNCGASLGPGASCTVTISFSPSSSGNFLATFTISGSDPGSPHTVQLSGTGISKSVVTITPSSLSFGSQTLGSSSAAQTVSVSNSGATSLTGTSMILSDPTDFFMTQNCPATLAPGAPCIFSITFTPSTAGSIGGSAVFTSSASSAPYYIPLSGTGISSSVSAITNTSGTVTIVAGQTATYQLSLSPQVFSGTVTLSCVETSAIANSNCTVAPNPVVLSGAAPALVGVSVTTTARTSFTPPHATNRNTFRDRRGIPFVGWILLSMLVAAAVALSDGCRPKRAILSAGLFVALILAGCGAVGGGSESPAPAATSVGTPAGTYQLLISASSKNVNQTMYLSLTVQ